MTPEALRDAIETAHAKLYPDSHNTLFGVRKVELGQLIVETVGVCEVDGFLAGHQHFVATLSTPKYAQLGQLFDEVPEAWELLDPQTVQPEDFVTNLELFVQAFIEAFPQAAAAAGVVGYDDAEASTHSNVFPLHPNPQDPKEDRTRTALDRLDGDPFTPQNTPEPTDKMGADEARMRLKFRELAENHKQLVRELVVKRIGMPAVALVSEKHVMAEGKVIRPSSPMPDGVLTATLKVFAEEGKAKAVDFFQKEFLYACGGASPDLLALIRRDENKFLWDVLRGRVDDAAYGRYLGIFLEIIQDVLVNAA